MRRTTKPLVGLATGATLLLAAGLLGSVFGETTRVLAADAPTGMPMTAARPTPVGPEVGPAPEGVGLGETPAAQLILENRALAENISALEGVLRDRETAYQSQWQQVQTELATARGRLKKAQTDQDGNQQRLEQLQRDLEIGDVAFQSEMQDKVAQLEVDEAQLRQQLEQTLAELRAAYDQVAALPPPATYGDGGSQHSSSSGDTNVSEPENDGEHDDDRHDDGEHDDGEHEDEGDDD